MVKSIKYCISLFIFSLWFSVKIMAQSNSYFLNPILAGSYPDPSICRADSYYYLVTSTFAYFPGIPVFQSKDLVNWKLIGHVLDRQEQLNLDGQGVSRGLFAPAIRYNKGIFYVTCTLVDIGGNFVVTAKSPAGPWSNPVWLPEINGIDPSFFFDDDGKAYILFNSDAPNNKPLYPGHRTIRMAEFDIQKMKVVSNSKILINGGTDITKKPIWIEGPHIYKVDGFYYLTAAEGGTAEDHSQVIFRSDSVDGPYFPYEKNPILTQRHLSSERKFPITSTGHADFIQSDDGSWWAVFLGCRPFERNNYSTGRETFLAPVKWIDGWPIINPDFEDVKYIYPSPIQSAIKSVDIPYNGNFVLRDEFDKENLHPSWIFLRTPHENWYSLENKQGILSIQLRPETCSGNMNPSLIARRQQHSKGEVAASFNFDPIGDNEKAGLLVFLNDTHNYFVCKSLKEGLPVIQLFKSTDDTSAAAQLELLAEKLIDVHSADKPLKIKISADAKFYHFYYAFDDKIWHEVKKDVDAAFLSVRIPRDFTGCVFAMYATSLGKPSSSKAYFDWFEYKGNDDIYNELFKGKPNE